MTEKKKGFTCPECGEQEVYEMPPFKGLVNLECKVCGWKNG